MYNIPTGGCALIRLTGKFIDVRDWTLPDQPFFRHWLQPEHEWQKFDGPYYPASTPAEIEEMIASREADIVGNSFPTPRHTMAIACKETDKLIGKVSWYWQGEETNWLCVGVSIFDPSYWGRGLGYEALGLWTDYILQANPALVRIGLATWSGNTRMLRLAEKLGFRQEACFRKARIVNGLYYDGMAYGALREEWEQLYPQGFTAHLLVSRT